MTLASDSCVANSNFLLRPARNYSHHVAGSVPKGGKEGGIDKQRVGSRQDRKGSKNTQSFSSYYFSRQRVRNVIDDFICCFFSVCFLFFYSTIYFLLPSCASSNPLQLLTSPRVDPLSSPHQQNFSGSRPIHIVFMIVWHNKISIHHKMIFSWHFYFGWMRVNGRKIYSITFQCSQFPSFLMFSRLAIRSRFYQHEMIIATSLTTPRLKWITFALFSGFYLAHLTMKQFQWIRIDVVGRCDTFEHVERFIEEDKKVSELRTYLCRYLCKPHKLFLLFFFWCIESGWGWSSRLGIFKISASVWQKFKLFWKSSKEKSFFWHVQIYSKSEKSAFSIWRLFLDSTESRSDVC